MVPYLLASPSQLPVCLPLFCFFSQGFLSVLSVLRSTLLFTPSGEPVTAQAPFVWNFLLFRWRSGVWVFVWPTDFGLLFNTPSWKFSF